ncbi:MAG: branched-chain amino acid ABC transporter permease [SAR202 cluster bacterium]|nr:branched-chain amino acid ABC transporter permease [SAR202 cluster bacterium]
MTGRPATSLAAIRRWSARINVADLLMWIVGGAILIFIVAGSIATLRLGIYSFRQWVDFIVFGLAQGGVYALIALGYTMVYGTLRMINFAHGEVFMSGAYTAYFLAFTLAQNGWIERYPVISLAMIFAVSMGTSALVAVLVERIAYRPLRNAPRLVALITAIGASFFLQYAFRGLYGSGFKAYPRMSFLEGSWSLGDFRILHLQVVVIVAAALMMAVLYLFIQKTKTGKAIRAVSEDKAAAALMGISVDRMIVITFVIGGLAAGFAGVLFALMFKQVHFFMGFIPGIKAFTAAVLGGIGNIPGAMIGGAFLGIFESLGPILFLDGFGIKAPYQLKDAIAFAMLVLVLIFRPTGVLGERLVQKKA